MEAVQQSVPEKVPNEKSSVQDAPPEFAHGEVVNASGHVQELDRNFSLASLIALGTVTGCQWPALAGGIVIAIYNGGPPGVLYEFIAVSIFYWFVVAAMAELSSAIPSSAGVYHFATVTGGPKFGRVCGFFAGWWNCLSWIFGAASMSAITGNIIISMWAVMHDDYVYERWHVFIVYLLATWSCCALVTFSNRSLPAVQLLAVFFILAGWFITMLVCAIMPSKTGSGYATTSFVWKDWVNQTGWPDGFAFLTGMLNGAYAVGAIDVVTHCAEEIPLPSRNVPKAMLYQTVIGFVTTLTYLVTIFYAVTSLDDVLGSAVPFPIATVYLQATGSRSGVVGLLFLLLVPITGTLIGCYVTAGRMLWTLARDDAAPFSKFFGKIDPKQRTPLNATLSCGVVVTVLGAIYVGSLTAFNAFIGSFVVLSASSFVAAILPNLLTKRKHVRPGPFFMKGALGYVVAGLASAYLIVFNVIYCFPYAMPVDAPTMNWTCLLVGGLSIFIAAWWFWKRSNGYVGPGAMLAKMLEIDDLRYGDGEAHAAIPAVMEK